MGVSTSRFSATEEGAALDPRRTQGHSLGVVRPVHVESAYNIVPLLQAASNKPVSIFNPNGSTGCSPILRLLLTQTGIAHSVVNEISLDGQPFGHNGGNAIDVGPGSVQNMLSDLRLAANVIKTFAPLFSCVCYQDAADAGRSLFIWDGAVVANAAALTGLAGSSAQFAQACQTDIHIASSKTRILHILKTDTNIQSIFTALPTSTTQGADREVFVQVQDFSVSVATTGQKNNTRW